MGAIVFLDNTGVSDQRMNKPDTVVDSLNHWLDYIQTLHDKTIDLGLDRVKAVATDLGLLPHKAWENADGKPTKIVTVAGTNGKGSTVAYMEQAALSHGLRVGSYSSPHFERFNERIRINGQCIADENMIEALTHVEQARLERPLSFFEFTTLCAFLWFKQAKLDWVLLEVGLGGRLDAVNILDADVSVVTSIGLDHVDFLGSDLNQIAYEKASIARKHCPLVIGEPKDYPAFTTLEDSVGFVRYHIERDFQLRLLEKPTSEKPSDKWSYTNGECCIELGLKNPGDSWKLVCNQPKLPKENLATAVQALFLLKNDWDRNVLAEALAAAQLPGRFQRPSSDFSLIVDVAHNQAAALVLNQRLREEKQLHKEQWLEYRLQQPQNEENSIPETADVVQPGLHVSSKIIAIFGALVDKDVKSIVKALTEVDHWACVSLYNERAYKASELVGTLSDLVPSKPVVGYHSVTEALSALAPTAAYSQHKMWDCDDEQKKSSNPGVTLIVLGSFVTVTESLQWLHGRGGCG